MAINTIKLTGVTVYMGQGSFLFYKKSSTGVTNTDVDVFVDNNYITTMSPTDHFNVDRVFGQIRLVPADLNNQAIFISADKAEEYGTAAVAGSVAITSLPPISTGSSFERYNLGLGNTYYTGISTTVANTTIQAPYFFVDFAAIGANRVIESISVDCFDSVTGDPLPLGVYGQIFSHTKSAITQQAGINKNNYTLDSAIEFGTAPPSGQINISGPQFSASKMFPIVLRASQGIQFFVQMPPSANLKTIYFTVNYSA